jgi:hypothetical protein
MAVYPEEALLVAYTISHDGFLQPVTGLDSGMVANHSISLFLEHCFQGLIHDHRYWEGY